jgi:glycosyltransferase involved in cell wall biosynthesis
MKIGIDIRSLIEGKQSGVEEYLLNLLDNLFKIDRQNEYRLFCNAYKAKSLDISRFSQFPNVKIYKFNWPNKILNLSFRIFNFPKIDKMLGGMDLFFAPNILFFGLSKECKLILTIHDLSFEYYKNFLTPWRRAWHYFLNPKKLALRANKIICPSYSTKNDLVKTYKIPEEKIEVIYSGINENFNKPQTASYKLKTKKYNLPEKYILFLGTFEPRKNILGIISAYSELKKKYKLSYKLVLAGGGGWKNSRISRKIAKEGLKEEIVLPGNIDANDKSAVLKLASLFIYPSFYEGFGFPPLEAMANGVPTVVSFCSSLPEVVGNGALFVNPYNVQELTEGMFLVLTDEKLRKNLVNNGYKQVKKFRWEETARRTLKVFEEIIR